jgi:hypothetical protein
MTDGDKIAAATLAAEAAKQKVKLTQDTGPKQGYNIGGELLTYYRYFLAELTKAPTTSP